MEQDMDLDEGLNDVFPPPRCGLLRGLDKCNVRRVTDADEETFLLYTLSPPAADTRGLGYCNGTSDILRVSIDLGNAVQAFHFEARDDESDEDERVAKAPKVRGRGAGARRAQTYRVMTEIVLDVRQDVTALRSNAGNTGSVIWRSSLALSAILMRQFSSSATSTSSALLDPAYLSRARVLELGAGTGVLGMLLLSHPIFDDVSLNGGATWLATDQAALLHLTRRNVARHRAGNANAVAGVASHQLLADSLDWVEASEVWNSANEARQLRFRKGALAAFEGRPSCSSSGEERGVVQEDVAWPDLIVATDCIYNPSLFPYLLSTLELLSKPGHTLSLIVCELRASESVSEWLEAWLTRETKWEVWGVDSEALGPLGKGNAVWIAWVRA